MCEASLVGVVNSRLVGTEWDCLKKKKNYTYTYTKPTPKPRVVKLSKMFQLSSQSQSVLHYDSANKMEWHTRMLQSLQTLPSASSNVLSWRANQWQQPIHPNAADWKDQHIRILSTEDLEFLQCTHHKLHAQKPLVPNGLLAFLTLFDQNAGWEVQTPWHFATPQPSKLAHACCVSSPHTA